MNTGFFENLAMNHRHHAAAKILRPIAAPPRRFFENARLAVAIQIAGFFFQLLKRGA